MVGFSKVTYLNSIYLGKISKEESGGGGSSVPAKKIIAFLEDSVMLVASPFDSQECDPDAKRVPDGKCNNNLQHRYNNEPLLVSFISSKVF